MNYKPAIKNPEDIEKKAAEVIHLMINEKKTLQEALGVPDKLLEEIYFLARAYYNQGKYKESLSLFEFLMNTSPNHYKFVLGVAASHHQLKAYNDAAFGFFLAYSLDIENPAPAYYAADSFLQLGNFEAANDFLSLAVEAASEKEEFTSLKERCLLIQKSLKVNK